MRQSALVQHPCPHGISAAAAVVWGAADTDASLATAMALPPVWQKPGWVWILAAGWEKRVQCPAQEMSHE